MLLRRRRVRRYHVLGYSASVHVCGSATTNIPTVSGSDRGEGLHLARHRHSIVQPAPHPSLRAHVIVGGRGVFIRMQPLKMHQRAFHPFRGGEVRGMEDAHAPFAALQAHESCLRVRRVRVRLESFSFHEDVYLRNSKYKYAGIRKRRRRAHA